MIFTRRLRKPFWIINSFFKKHKLIILVTTLIAVFLFLFIKNLLPLVPKPKPRLTIGIVGQYTMTTLPHQISQSISRGLTKVDSSGTIQPDIARSWEILENDTLYRVFLEPNILWNDDTILTSKDIVIDIPNVEVSHPDDLTIEFKLQEPFSPFLVVLSRPLFKDKIISAGSYTIKKTKYSGPFLKTLELIGDQNNTKYHFYPSNQAAWLGFKLGEVDQLQNLIINPVNDKWRSKLDLVETINYQQYLGVVFNIKDPQLSNKPLRQALAYAIENKAPSKTARSLSPISPQSWAFNSKVKTYTYSPTQSKELFEKFEQEASISGKLKLNLGTSQSFLSLAESVAQSWEKVLPVEVDVKIINSISDDFQAILIAQEIPLDPDQHALWHSTQDTNISNYSDLKVDKLLEDGRKEIDQKVRLEIYKDFQKFIVEDLPAIFLRHPTTYTISRK